MGHDLLCKIGELREGGETNEAHGYLATMISGRIMSHIYTAFPTGKKRKEVDTWLSHPVMSYLN